MSAIVKENLGLSRIRRHIAKSKQRMICNIADRLNAYTQTNRLCFRRAVGHAVAQRLT